MTHDRLALQLGCGFIPKDLGRQESDGGAEEILLSLGFSKTEKNEILEVKVNPRENARIYSVSGEIRGLIGKDGY